WESDQPYATLPIVGQFLQLLYIGILKGSGR
ncbi:MAG: hypothetical protein ACI8S3_002748, partial [Alphaproteobacteria bacterium]